MLGKDKYQPRSNTRRIQARTRGPAPSAHRVARLHHTIHASSILGQQRAVARLRSGTPAHERHKWNTRAPSGKATRSGVSDLAASSKPHKTTPRNGERPHLPSSTGPDLPSSSAFDSELRSCSLKSNSWAASLCQKALAKGTGRTLPTSPSTMFANNLLLSSKLHPANRRRCHLPHLGQVLIYSGRSARAGTMAHRLLGTGYCMPPHNDPHNDPTTPGLSPMGLPWSVVWNMDLLRSLVYDAVQVHMITVYRPISCTQVWETTTSGPTGSHPFQTSTCVTSYTWNLRVKNHAF